jgi:DUF4097 and DUF4098 domain-containing protein YvlB
MGEMTTRNFVYDNISAVSVRGLGSGELRVGGSTDDGVQGAVTSYDDSLLDQISLSEHDGKLRIDFPQHVHSDATLELKVPEDTVLEATTGSADISADVALGATRITTGSGDISLDTVAEAQLITGSGDISINKITGSAGQVTSGSGDISIGGSSAALQAKSASGDVNVGELSGALSANTASGDINVGRTTGSVESRSSSGDINVAVGDSLPAWLDLRSVSGEVLIGLDASNQPEDGEPYVSIRANTASGDISISRG